MTVAADAPYTTAAASAFWAAQPLTLELQAQYLSSTYEPHRQWAVDAVASLPDVRTVLELGCHCGPLLERLGKLSGVVAYGLDLNPEAVVAAQVRGLLAGLGDVPACLARCPDRTFDVVVSSYCLAYISPADLPDALAGMLRIAEVGVVLVEPMAGPGVGEEEFSDRNYVEWRHDYMRAMDAALASTGRPADLASVGLTRTARGPHAGINGVVVGRCRWL